MQSFVFRSRVVRANLLVACAAIAAACGGGTDEPKVPAKDVTPATITSDVTGTLTGVVGTQLNTVLSVTVANKAGTALDTIPVTFAVTSGGGTVSNATVKTTAGKATTTWTLGPTVGTQTVTATVAGLAPVTFTATATAGAAKNIAKNSTDPQTAVAGANVAVAPSVKVTDATGNPVSGVLVTFAVASGGGSVVGGLANTDANGVATATSWRLGATAGANTLTATAAGITTPVTFSATGTVGAASTIQITNTAPTLNAGQTFSFATLVKDANGNTVSNPTVTWSTSNASVATVSSAGVVTGVGAGTATITATTGTLTATQAVSVLGHPGTTASATVAMNSSVGGISIVGGVAYVARSTASAIGVVDLASGTLTTSVDLGARVNDVAAAPNVVVGASNAGLLWFVNSANVRTDSLELDAVPVKLAMTSTGNRVLADMNNFYVAVVDVASRSVVGNISVGGTPAAFKMGKGDTLAYLATRLGRIFVISVSGGTVRRAFDSGVNPVDIAISPDGKTAFIADGTANVTVLPLATGGMAATTVSFPAIVTAVAVSPDGARLWAGYAGGIGTVPIVNNNFDVPSLAPIANLNPSQIVFDRLGSFAVVADAALNQLIILK